MIAVVIVDGENSLGEPSTWNVDTTTVGTSDDGRLMVENGAQALADFETIGRDEESTGSVEVRGVAADGSPSHFSTTGTLRVGVSGNGFLRIEDGATAANPLVEIAAMPTSNSSAAVRGIDAAGNPSTWTTDVLFVGDQGVGEVTVEDGAIATSRGAVVGESGSGTVEIQGTDAAGNPSTWTISESLEVGRFLNGSITVGSGGLMVSDTTTIAGGNSSRGEVFVQGTPSSTGNWTNAGDVFLGGTDSAAGGEAFLRLFLNGRAEIGGQLKIWGDGLLHITGGRLLVDEIDHSEGGEFDFESGLLQVNHFDGDMLNEGGTLAPGPDAGTTTIIGDYTQQTDATLAIDIGGTSPGVTYDLVNISGDAILNGDLQLTVIDDFQPESADSFTVLSADSLIGVFDNVLSGQRLLTIDGSGSFVVNYGIGSPLDETRVVLSAFEPSDILAGDYNGDGVVSAADYVVWRNNLGETVELPGDTTPGVVTQQDYDVWVLNFGNSASGSGSQLAAVPEPTATLLIIAAFFTQPFRMICRTEPRT